jgi:hypothetical protein
MANNPINIKDTDDETQSKRNCFSEEKKIHLFANLVISLLVVLFDNFGQCNIRINQSCQY